MVLQILETKPEFVQDLFDNTYYFKYPVDSSPKLAPKAIKQSAFKTDVFSTQQEYVIEVELPGFTKESIEVTLEQDLLTIEATPPAEQTEKTKYILKERKNEKFIRSFQLPKYVDSNSTVEAQLRDGILRIALAIRQQDAGKRTIKLE